MKVVIVVPTYNEGKNISLFLEALHTEFVKYPQYNWNVLVVDGNSTDSTQKDVLEKATHYTNIFLLPEEKKAGLGAAYLFGFQHAVKTLNAEVVVEMDADFQHNPADLIKLIKKIDDGYDYVIGSRYIKGGSVPETWAFYRKMLSWGGSLFSKIVLGIFEINDFTSGFKACRVKGFLDKLDYSKVLSKGFAYKIDLLFKIYKLGAKFAEVPISFGLRDRGDSKMEKNNFIDSLKVVVWLGLHERKNFVKFLIVGFTGLFVDTLTFNIFRVAFSHSSAAVLVAGLFGMVTTYLLNNYWSFGERKIEGLHKQTLGLVLYVGTSLVPIFVRYNLVHWFNVWFGDTFIISNLAFFLGILFGLVWNYTVYSKFIWRKTGV